MMAQNLSFQNLVFLDSCYSLTPHSTNKSVSRHFHVQMPRKLKDGFFYFLFFSQIFCTSYTDCVRREEKGNRANRGLR